MKPSIPFLSIEFLILFILLPVLLAVEISAYVKIGLVLIGFGYLLVLLKRNGQMKFRLQTNIDWSAFWKRTLVTFVCIAIVTSAFVYFKAPESLFYVPLNNPKLFVVILMVYAFLSVWPQEVIYRTFFFERYASLFKDEKLLIFVNAIVFSLAHLFFKNTLVLILTFIGGIIFGLSYLKFKSTTLVSIEHALYGNWLFTVGMGEMLAFPGMETA